MNKRTVLGFMLAAALGFQVPAQASWTDVSGQGVAGINFDSSRSAERVSMVVLPGTPDRLYAAWSEVGGQNGATTQIRVAVYNASDLSPNWSFIDGSVGGQNRPSNQGINRDPRIAAHSPKLAINNNEVYATWTEGGSPGQIRVARYNGDDQNPNWNFVDGNNAKVGLNINSKKDAGSPVAIESAGSLFVAWSEQGGSRSGNIYQIRVKHFNGSTWSSVDGAGKFGINYDVENSASRPSLAVVDGVLLAVWSEVVSQSSTRIRTKAYAGSGSTWHGIDAGGLSRGGGLAAYPKALELNSKLFISFEEDNKIYLSSFDGSVWADEGGSLNYDQGRSAYRTDIEAHAGLVYISWLEHDGVGYKIRVKSYDGLNFISEDDGIGVSKYSPGSTAQYSALKSFNSKIYLGWHEDLNGVNQVNIAVQD